MVAVVAPTILLVQLAFVLLLLNWASGYVAVLGEEPSRIPYPNYLLVGFAVHLADPFQPQTSPNLLILALPNLHHLLFPLEFLGHH